jgi:hypothetical protein
MRLTEVVIYHRPRLSFARCPRAFVRRSRGLKGSLGPDLPLPCALDQLVGDPQRLLRPAGERR